VKILYINKVSPRLGGGAELRLLEVGSRLAANGHSVYVLCGMTEPGLPDHERIKGIDVYYMKLLPAPFFRFHRLSFYLSRYLFYPAVLGAGRLVTSLSPDIIIDYASPAPSLIYPVAQRLGVPCYVEVMDYRGNQWFRLAGPITALLGWSSQFFLRKFQYDKIIAISDFTSQQLKQAGLPPNKITVVPCGIDVENHSTEVPTERDRNSLIMVGRLVPIKGHVYLFDALSLVRERLPEVQLRIVGDGPIRSDLQRYVQERGLGGNVVFTGRVTEEEKIQLLHSSSVFVSSSLLEGFGLVLLEAMACGLPVVAFDLPTYREFMDSRSGFLVPERDAQALAEHIIHLLEDDRTRARMSAHNLVHVQRYGWDRVAEAEEKVLSEQLAL
jgi:glycosyltransferase involved in cell wall biosynthesis